MTVCTSCGRETSRSITKFDKHGNVKSDQCPPCAGESAKFVSITDRKLWTGPQCDPDRYTKRDNHDGSVTFIPTDEERADQHEALLGENKEDENARKAALEERRRNGPGDPLTPTQILACINRYQEMEARAKAEAAGLYVP